MKDSWEKVKLDELGKHYGGLTNKSKDDFGKGKPYIPYLNIFTNGKIDIDDLDLVDVKSNEHQNKVKKGDLFFTTSSETPHEVGMTSVLIDDIGEAYLNSFCFGFRLDNFESLLPEFAVHLFRGKEVRKTISDLAQGSTRYNLSKSIFFDKLYLNLPPLPQQRKIAKILSTVDAVIEKTEAAIAKYQQLKQGLMQDVFTRGIDVTTGKLRPKPEDAPDLYKASELGWIPKEWEVKRLEDVLNVSSGQGLSKQNLKPGHFKVYGGNGINGLHDSYLYQERRLIIGRVGEHCGNVHITEPLSWITDNALIVKPNSSDFDLIFWKYFLIHLELNSLAFAAAQPVITGGILYKVKIKNISQLEQKSITSKLKAIDQKIHTEQRALAKYQQLKAGLMQDLLTGEVSV